jgi:hypothetical protein
MATSATRVVPVHGTDTDEFRALARRIDIPSVTGAEDLTFTPAFGGFRIGQTRDVDISHLHIPASENPLAIPRHRPLMDIHHDSEEVWVVTRGELVMGMAESSRGAGTIPSVNDLQCFYLREGDAIVLPAGRWHGGIWGVNPGEVSEFLMFLSGHRSSETGQLVDHVMESYAEDAAVVPDPAFLGMLR